MTPNTSPDAVPDFPDKAPPIPRRKQLMEPLIAIAFIAALLVLQIWVLPKMGVRT